MVVVSFIIIMFCLLPNKNETNCKLYQEFVYLNIDGVVTNKYLDKHEHSYPTIEIKLFKNDSILKVNLVGEKSGLYSLLCKSDTNKKLKQSNIVCRKINGKFVNLVKVDFGCKGNDH